MKSLFRPSMLAAAVLVTITVAGCATDPSQRSQASQNSMGSMDTMAMCRDMHTQMMSAKTPQERQAIMAEHMKDMSPGMMQHCPMMQGQQGSQSTK